MTQSRHSLIKDDEMGARCRLRTKSGTRCKRTGQWLIPVGSTREDWLGALRTGWPRMVRGMRPPTERYISLCRQHGDKHDRKGPAYFYGIGRVGPVTLGPDYEAARKAGDDAVRAAGFDA